MADTAPKAAQEPTSTTQGPPLLRVKDLRVQVADQLLLEQAEMRLHKGQCVLLVGPSGAGKSVLLKLFSGLIDHSTEPFKFAGSVELCGTEVLNQRRSSKVTKAFRKTGLVFQDHALFDEFSVQDNVEFARDHSLSKAAPEATKRALEFLKQAGIDPKARVQTLSGGQKQRVAISRTLAADPEIMVYDEPTSALDPRSSRLVAELIRQTTDEFHKTALIVSHDYEPFEGLVDHVIFLDPTEKTLKTISFEELAGVMADAKVPEHVAKPAEAWSGKNLARALGDKATRFFEETWLIASGNLRNAIYALPPFLHLSFLHHGRTRLRWFLSYLAHYARLIFWGSAIPYMLIAGTIVGFVATYFTFTRLPHGQHFQDEILPALGAALYRVAIPVLTTLLVAGRTGAALSSDLGNRVLSNQITAMRNFGVEERSYLLTSILWMNAFGTMFLNAVAYTAASLTSLVVFTLTQESRTPFFWSSFYFNKVWPEPGHWLPPHTGFVFWKLLFCSLVISAVSYKVGAAKKRSGAEVSFATTTTVYWATVCVLIVHFIFAFFEFQKPNF